MSGRGDHNKSGTSGQGSSNQSNQGFGKAAEDKKSNSGKPTGGNASQPQPKSKSSSANRDTGEQKKD